MSNLQIYPHLQTYPLAKYSTQFHIHRLNTIMSYLKPVFLLVQKVPGQLVKECLMSPRFITYLASIFLTSELEKIGKGSVCLYISASPASPEDITEMRDLEQRMKNTVSTMMQIARQHLPFQYGAIKWASNVLVSKRYQKSGKLVFWTMSPYKTLMVCHCYQKEG